MRRRHFFRLSAAAAAWPLAARAQPAQMRRLAVLFVVGEDRTRPWLAALREGLEKLGWTEGQNLQIELRFGRGDAALIKRHTDELLGLQPDVVLAHGVVGAGALQRATKSVPVVFVQVQDPVGGGFVTNLARPDGNLTGFTNFDYSMVGKWLELLKEVDPRVTRAVAIINPDDRTRWNGYASALDRLAPQLGIRASIAGVRDAADIERVIAALADEPNGGLLVLPDATAGVYAQRIVDLAAHHRLPAVYAYDSFVRQGGLIAYAENTPDQFRRAAAYIDRLLRGARVSDLPVQAVERYKTVLNLKTAALNLKTAAALELTISPALLARVDEVIE